MIKVNCLAPKHAKGEYEFGKFEELFYWLAKIRGLAKGDPGNILFGLAKDGFYRVSTARFSIGIECDFQDYFVAREVAERVGLLRHKRGSDILNSDRSVALRFAKILDEEALQHA
jgi:hypothetical protein